MESQSENNHPKHWTAIYVLPIQLWEAEPQLHFVVLESTSSIFLERPKVLIQWNRPNPFYYVFHRVLWLVHICESKCMVSVILPSPTAHNDSDSDIVSLAGWFRLGSQGTHRQPGRAGPGNLNLKPRFAKPHIMAGAGVLPAQRRTGRPTSWARRRCASSNLNLVDIYHMIYPLVSGTVVRAALQYAWDPLFESQSHECFCKMSHTRIYAYIRTCTQIYSVH